MLVLHIRLFGKASKLITSDMTTKKSHIRLVFLCMFFILYVVIGASIFCSIEGPLERQQVKDLRRARTEFLQLNRGCITGITACMDLLLSIPCGVFLLINLPARI